VPHPMSSLSDEDLVKGADTIFDGVAKIVGATLPPEKTGNR
jgi:hypothetical protein